MAQQRLTDRTALNETPNDSDLIHVVDVSDTTDNPNGTSKKLTVANLLGGITAVGTQPVENEYADITALLADQGNQTETFFQYVIDASADPNIASGDAYYEKLATSTATLADDYRLLSDTETQIITDSNGYRVFRIQYIQDDSSPNNTATGGRIGFNYDTGTDKVTSVVFNNIYSNALDIFYAQRASNTYKLKFYNRNTGVYSFATVTGWTVNGNYYIVDVDSGIDISEISVNNRIELFFEIDNSGTGVGTLEYGTAITGASTTLTTSNLNTVNRFESASAQTATLNAGVFSLNDEIYFTRTGAGSFELVKGTNVRLTGVRDIDNRFFINDKNSWICAKYLEDDGSTEVWQVFGRLTEGYTGAVTTSSYSSLIEGDIAKDVTVIGTGFSSNMEDPVVSANATLNSWTYVSHTQITLNLDAVGVATNTVTVTYDNGDVFVDTDAITIGDVSYAYDPADLIHYYPLITDSSDAVSTNPINGTDTAITYSSGAVFDGTTSKITLADDNSFSFGDSSTDSDFSITGIINGDSVTGGRILCKWGSGSNTEYRLELSSGELRLACSDASVPATLTYITNNATLSTSTSYHFAVTKTGSTFKIYIDKVEKTLTSEGSGSYVAMENGTEPLVIGALSYSFSSAFDGTIKRIGIWNKVLSQAEIDDIFMQEVTNDVDLL